MERITNESQPKITEQDFERWQKLLKKGSELSEEEIEFLIEQNQRNGLDRAMY